MRIVRAEWATTVTADPGIVLDNPLRPQSVTASVLLAMCGLVSLLTACSGENDVNGAADPASGSPAAIAYESTEPMFDAPYIDIDEWRDEPVKHRYVHGGFENTDTRFSFYFPPADQYDGRFYQYITPVPDSENLSQGASGEEDKIGFSIASGAYFVETNGGGKFGMAMPGVQSDPTIGAFRANAAAARYSRAVARLMYGTERPFGYSFGGSGGAFRTVAGVENTEGVWDGSVPFVLGSPMALPNVFTVRAYAMRVLEKKLPVIADAIDVGSNRNPFTDTGLNDEERGALIEVTRLGFPLRGWHAHDHMGLHAFPVIFPAVIAIDPAYFEEFWTTPGYEGNAPPASLSAALIDHTTTIAKLIHADEALALGLDAGHLAGRPKGLADDAWKAVQGDRSMQAPVAIQLATAPSANTLGAELTVVSGNAAGSALPMASQENDIVILSPGPDEALAKIEAGDEVRFGNRDFLAVQTYHRHQVPGPEFVVWDQFRNDDGTPLYPQRPMLLGPILAKGATGTEQTGDFNGKMILVENLYDTEAFAWQADWYRARAREHLGPGLDANFRLWMIDHANHGDFTRQRDPTHTVSYLGVLQQALRDVADWVENGVDPADNTVYELLDGQIVVPDSAARRKGIQPVVTVTANGGERAEVKAGEAVELVGIVEVPTGTGTVVSAEWDLDGEGNYPLAAGLEKAGDERVEVRLSHRFTEPGTHFVTLRAASQRAGDATTPFARVQNLGRARVVVE